jgi:hypothetical protein
VPPQVVPPDGQTQALPLQIAPPLHAVPQAPPQEVSPAAHEEAQRQKSHTSPAAHWTPQPPQLATLDFRSTQTPPQAISPSGHTHWPSLHTLPAAQAMSHAPQWSWSLLVATHTAPQRRVPVEQAGTTQSPSHAEASPGGNVTGRVGTSPRVGAMSPEPASSVGVTIVIEPQPRARVQSKLTRQFR